MKREIIYLSNPEPVSMADAWFDIASLNHFWIRRRFEVLCKLAPQFDWPQLRLGEIGSGKGFVQRQLEDEFNVEVDGFDLNEDALKRAVCRKSRCHCYNIHACAAGLRETYDILFLWDVIEHIEDQRNFLASALYHLKIGGSLIINVPAVPALWSAYDTVAGHLRRYTPEELMEVVESSGAETTAWTYWGRPLVPLLRIRKHRLEKMSGEAHILRDGFGSRGRLVNSGLLALSRCERIPQRAKGTSLMLVARRIR
jgi:SAM-dependent methyltransferase